MDEAKEELKTSLKQEISLMRELLANLHQEERSLLMKDKGSWNVIMQQRSEMIARIGVLRQLRENATKKFPIQATSEECDIVSMGDQLMALVERMNFQNLRNQDLLSQIGPQFEFPFMPQPFPEPTQAKKKSGLATYPDEPLN